MEKIVQSRELQLTLKCGILKTTCPIYKEKEKKHVSCEFLFSLTGSQYQLKLFDQTKYLFGRPQNAVLDCLVSERRIWGKRFPRAIKNTRG